MYLCRDFYLEVDATGKVEIGFFAEGAANSFCYTDDVSLVKD